MEGEVLLRKNEKGLIFNFGYPHFKTLYNKEANFNIFHNSFGIKINHYLVKNDNQNFLQRICNVYMFQSMNFNDEKENFHHYYSKIDNVFLISFLQANQIGLSINIDGFNFKISTCEICYDIKHVFLCVECDTKISFKNFKHYVNNIIVSAAFFTGNFFKLEELYFQSQFADFSDLTDVFYRNSNTKYSFPYPITKFPSEWNWKFKSDFILSKDVENNWSSFIDEKKFKLFVNLLISKPRIYFSIRIIFDFYKSPSISRVSLMFVVLETLCEELNIKNTRVEKQLKQEIGIETLNRLKDKISDEDFNVLNDIVENIDNKLTNNAVHFEQTLRSLGMNYSNEERNILNKRNDFFHGRIIPNSHQIESEEEFINLERKYNYYSLRLYVLISKILLKKIGFDGYFINYPKIFEDDNEMNLKESYFIKL
ncbi:MAG: hypothetical protein O9282_02210 [Flavobacterium sp.]|uniref:hypothetical protein n=1 Tax=Flavobacterium sp. TaxID=239 RepID=UPI0022C3F80F|nr:hypothetical protein [Flavobacterium sp.]MCZ8089616.1 hypothetical protein [Flavobacterium sp.]MCZ8330107.1 hypothetical protein [Flavobacterium sp.]